MTTSDKHCQTFAEGTPRVMYDESVTVVDAREIASPAGSDEGDVRAVMAKFTPPTRRTARHDFDSESESDSSPDKFTAGISEDESPDRQPASPDKEAEQRPAAKESSGRGRQTSKRREHDSSDSDSDSGSVGLERPAAPAGGRRGGGVVIPAEGAYDPKQFQDLKVPPEMENIFQYIMKYTPQKIDIELKLQPFVPEYVPAVGDPDAFLKVCTPAVGPRGAPLADAALDFIDNLGLTVLDEPAAEQSDAALLHLQLRALSKTSSAKSTVLTRKIEDAEKNPKAIDRWIRDVSELHAARPPPTVTYTSKMPDIDSLMEEWPAAVEATLNEVGVPPPALACSLPEYVALVCALFDAPLPTASLNDSIQALHLLFSLYSAVKNSQLYAERQKEKGG